MFTKYPQQNYIYTSSKPKKSGGDSSLESESFNDNEKENDLLMNDNLFEFSKESNLPDIHIPFNNKELLPQNKQGLFFCSVTKDTENGGIRGNSNNKDDNFSMKKVINVDKENNRYTDINHLYKNNCHFFNSLQLDVKDDEEDEDIVNNEISVNFVDELKNTYIYKKDNQVEILLDNHISKIDSNNDMSNNNKIINNFNRINKNKIYDNKNGKLIRNKKINESIKKSKQNINNNTKDWNNHNNIQAKKNNIINLKNIDNNGDDYFVENKENYIRNGQYDTEVKINLNQIFEQNKYSKKKNIEINKNENNNININSNINLNKNFFEIKNSKNLNDIFISKSKSIKNYSLKRRKIRNMAYLTKKYKIFHKFLCVSVDTSGLYTLDDDIQSLLLNPKITYNYPFNNLENELE